MLSLWLLTKKNVKILIRARASALIILFAPLIIVLLLGVSYNTSSLYGLNIGIYANSYTEDVNSFINVLQEEEFTITNYDTSIEDCSNDVKAGKIHTCVHLPESLQVDSNSAKEITFYVDSSRINIVWMVQEVIKEKFNIKAQELSKELTGGILGKLSEAKTVVSTNNELISSAKDKTSSASATTSSTKSGLGSLNLNMPTSNYTDTQITAISKDLKTVEGRINSALTYLEESNVSSSDKTNLKKKLEVAQKILSGESNVSTTGIVTIVESLQNDLTALKSQVSNAATTVESSTSNLNTAVSVLSESVNSLEQVKSNLAMLLVNLEGQQVTDASTISSPITTKIETVSEESTYLAYLFPAILVIVVMFSSLLLGTTLVMMEKTSPAFLRNFFLPIRKASFIISTYLTNLILILIQIIVILGISLIFLKGSLNSIPYVALILFVSASMFTFLGMVIGYLFNSEETAVLASFSIGSLFLFVSGVILPLEGMATIVREIAAFNPFVITENLLRSVFIFGTALQSNWFDLVLLIVYAVILFLVIMIIESVFHKHLVKRFMRHHHRAHRQKDKKKIGK
jgi:ABC-type multidrug transport system permease subunit